MTPRKNFPGREVLLTTVGVAILIAFPRSSWNYTRTHTLTDGTIVSRTTNVNHLGLPFEWIDIRRHAWSAFRDGQEVPVGDAAVDGFAELELAERSNSFRCGPARFTLGSRASRRDEVLLRTDPRASAVVARWGVLATDLTACMTPLTMLAYLRRRKRLGVVNRWRLRGQCTGCGYDLTGNVSGTCPECGNPT